MGNLDIYPKQKGETTIQVKDNIAHETTDLRIKIVDSYLHLSINNPVRPPYKQGDEIFLINNDDKDFYLYDDKLKIKSTGNYEFSIKGNIPFLTLTYHKELENRTIYKYNLTGTDQTMFAVIKLFFRLGLARFHRKSKDKRNSTYYNESNRYRNQYRILSNKKSN